MSATRKPLDYSAVLRMLARTWNLAHGRTEPESESTWIEEMATLVADGDPDIVCLQEVPVWALGSLARWSRMQAIGAVAMRPRAGAMGRWLTALQPRRLRSALTGQANAILVHGKHGGVGPSATLELNDRTLRAETGKTLGLGRSDRKHWARNRRVCQTLRVQIGQRAIVVANMHLTHFDQRLAEAELAKASAFVDQVAGPATPSLLGGDLNIPGSAVAAFAPVSAAGYTRAASGIDHLLGRGLTLGRGPAPLDDRLRTHNGLRLSDHP
ncbi:MAG: endonuclease/exonuclease/phosphatase family protein, partial [Gaiellaceae bacterium]